QPWASLFAAGAKRIETRAWQTSIRGTLAVHAAEVVDVDACYKPPFAEVLARLGFNEPKDLPVGVVLGTVDLIDCVPITPELVRTLTDTERALGNYGPGRFAWLTSEKRLVLAKPIPLRGFQRIWK